MVSNLPSVRLASPGATRLWARTFALEGADAPVDLLDHLGANGFAWLQGDAGFVTAGVAACIPATAAAATLDAVAREGAPPSAAPIAGPIAGSNTGPIAGPIAVGALPFDRPGSADLVIPARVVSRDADGRGWVTVIGAPGNQAGAEARAERPPLRSAPRYPARFTIASSIDSDRWAAMVEEALAAIGTGLLEKVVLAREVVVEADEPFDVATVLARLRATQPGCAVFAAGGFVGASPELLVQVSGERVTSRPMAGTARRGGTDAEDAAAVAALLTSGKDAEEHRLVVEAITEVLQERCEDVVVGRTEAARLATVTHLATTIGARRAPTPTSPGALDLALALHPTPAVGGTPRDAALDLIARLEPAGRGRYAGPVGWVGAGGDGEWAVALRSAVLESEAGLPDRADMTGVSGKAPAGSDLRGGRARLLAGAGIVAGSQPAAEWAETQAKLEPMLRALIVP